MEIDPEIKKIYASYSEEEQRDIQETLDRYFNLVIRIHERIQAEETQKKLLKYPGS